MASKGVLQGVDDLTRPANSTVDSSGLRMVSSQAQEHTCTFSGSCGYSGPSHRALKEHLRTFHALRYTIAHQNTEYTIQRVSGLVQCPVGAEWSYNGTTDIRNLQNHLNGASMDEDKLEDIERRGIPCILDTGISLYAQYWPSADGPKAMSRESPPQLVPIPQWLEDTAPSAGARKWIPFQRSPSPEGGQVLSPAPFGHHGQLEGGSALDDFEPMTDGGDVPSVPAPRPSSALSRESMDCNKFNGIPPPAKRPSLDSENENVLLKSGTLHRVVGGSIYGHAITHTCAGIRAHPDSTFSGLDASPWEILKITHTLNLEITGEDLPQRPLSPLFQSLQNSTTQSYTTLPPNPSLLRSQPDPAPARFASITSICSHAPALTELYIDQFRTTVPGANPGIVNILAATPGLTSLKLVADTSIPADWVTDRIFDGIKQLPVPLLPVLRELWLQGLTWTGRLWTWSSPAVPGP
ncbi:hypothetical protein C8R43DRAFT_942691 [Mycena crocata]|nr:hypothetical protein C8R43DRAFT_942691 [Mycena crocata]